MAGSAHSSSSELYTFGTPSSSATAFPRSGSTSQMAAREKCWGTFWNAVMWLLPMPHPTTAAFNILGMGGKAAQATGPRAEGK